MIGKILTELLYENKEKARGNFFNKKLPVFIL